MSDTDAKAILSRGQITEADLGDFASFVAEVFASEEFTKIFLAHAPLFLDPDIEPTPEMAVRFIDIISTDNRISDYVTDLIFHVVNRHGMNVKKVATEVADTLVENKQNLIRRAIAAEVKAAETGIGPASTSKTSAASSFRGVPRDWLRGKKMPYMSAEEGRGLLKPQVASKVLRPDDPRALKMIKGWTREAIEESGRLAKEYLDAERRRGGIAGGGPKKVHGKRTKGGGFTMR